MVLNRPMPELAARGVLARYAPARDRHAHDLPGSEPFDLGVLTPSISVFQQLGRVRTPMRPSELGITSPTPGPTPAEGMPPC
jgi:hypothetical protein